LLASCAWQVAWSSVRPSCRRRSGWHVVMILR
jgi:hypothetical protein